jgi:hypothetical protein
MIDVYYYNNPPVGSGKLRHRAVKHSDEGQATLLGTVARFEPRQSELLSLWSSGFLESIFSSCRFTCGETESRTLEATYIGEGRVSGGILWTPRLLFFLLYTLVCNTGKLSILSGSSGGGSVIFQTHTLSPP